MAHVIVVGGGISGLVAAYRLGRQPEMSVTLLEGGDRLGGKIATVPFGDARVELGADSFLPRDDRPLQLCRDIGIEGDLVEPSGFGGSVWWRGALRPLPAGTVLGFPTSLRSIARTRILSSTGRVRAAAETLRRRPLSGPDVSVAEFTRGRFGHELLERVVDPLLAGTRAGDVTQMSLAAAIPPVDAAARGHGSVTRGLAAMRSNGVAPRFLAPRSGMQALIDALAAHIQGDVRLDSPARSVTPRGGGFTIELDNGDLSCDGVLVATPSNRAAELVSGWAPQAAWHLNQIPHSAGAVVNLLFPPAAVTVPAVGSGVLVPSSEAMTISGCTWFSSKWPALASENAVNIRCFVGRGARDPALDLDDRDLSGVVVEELSRIVSVSRPPTDSLVTRWDHGMPVYRVGHLDRVARIEALLGEHPGVALSGADYRGSGIPDCIAQADRAVTGVLEHLRR